MPLDQLDVKEEKKLLLRSLREAGRQVRVRFEAATSDNLRKMVTLGTRALHYSGHGLVDELVFEDKYGLPGFWNLVRPDYQNIYRKNHQNLFASLIIWE